MAHRLALCLALLTLLVAVWAYDAAPPRRVSAAPAARETVPAPALSKQQVYERSEKCGKASRDQFRRDWKDGIIATANGQITADYTNHYNAKLDTCFYLLTVRHVTDSSGESGTSGIRLGKMLFDADDGEKYGEYSGPLSGGTPTARLPATCRIEATYCASRGEWEVLVAPYMGD